MARFEIDSDEIDADEVEDILGRAVGRFSGRDYVTGVDVGEKLTDGVATGDLSIRVHVEEKFAAEHLTGKDLFPDEFEGIPLDVIQSRYRPSDGSSVDPDRRRALSPLQPGISVGSPHTTLGTLGLIVYDIQTSHPCILSNWHVLAGNTQDPIIQPGKYDGGTVEHHTVALLWRQMLGLKGDAAIAALTDSRQYALEPFRTNDILTYARKPIIGEILTKSGRTTGITHARVEGAGVYQVDYPGYGRHRISGFRLEPELPGNPRREEISEDGDSGSVWYSQRDLAAVGLNFAGETDNYFRNEHALACHMSDVLSEMQVSLTPGPEGGRYVHLEDLFEAT